MKQFTLPKKIYFEKNSVSYLIKMENVERVLLLTSPETVEAGFVDIVRSTLQKRKNFVSIEVSAFGKENASETIQSNIDLATQFKADTIITVGNTPVIKVAKEVAGATGIKHAVVPTSSSLGQEMIFESTKTLLPEIVIVDGQFIANQSSKRVLTSGLKALGNAIGSYLSEESNDYSEGLSLQATKTLVNTLELASATGDYDARENVHNAAAVAGIAANNTAFTGGFESVLNSLQTGENEEKAEDIVNYIGLENVEALVGKLTALKALAS
ncbi:MAG: iron-containing alcohol dehydrogenase [Streptococcaceae bacterium]|jgi:acetaldehyde dehydrogenase/alcohol dehydrogenase|nr:iron-containing alcohol dehydrogenase [Streptococcaceae bacterium]